MAEFGVGDLDDLGIEEGILIVESGVEVNLAIGENERLGKFLS